MNANKKTEQTARYVGGLKQARAVLKRNPKSVRRLLVAENYHGKPLNEIKSLANTHSIRVQTVPRVKLDRLEVPHEHQGVVVEITRFGPHTESEFEQRFTSWENPLILALDTVQDPRNLGACLRTAEGAGVTAVLMGKNRCAPLTDVVDRIATGVLESMYLVQVANLVRTLGWLKEQGCWLTGADDQASALYTKVDYRSSTVIVVGNEGTGLRKLTKDLCDHVVTIPMNGNATSLNVSVATGVLLYEARRQRDILVT